MISEIFGLLSSVDISGKGIDRKFKVNLNRNRIRSISAYSSNSIFYFPMVVSDQITPEESAMIIRLSEKSNASFVVACISLMPFHRVRADDKMAIEEYLTQFHQNLGFNPGSNQAMQKMFGFIDSLEETAAKLSENDAVAQLQDFLYEAWQKSQRENLDFIKLVAESVSINDMYNLEAVDPKTRLLQEQYQAKMDELNLWGFLGEATDDMFDGDIDIEKLLAGEDDDDDFDFDDDYDDLDLDEASSKGSIRKAVTSAIKAANAGSFVKAEYTVDKDDKTRVTVAYYSLHDFTNGHAREAMRTGKAEELDGIIRNICNNISKSLSGVVSKVDVAGDWDEGSIILHLNNSMNEGTIKQAIDNVKFSLESVSANKIMSCKNLTKLATLEAKLKKLKNKYAKYLNRYKRKHKENQKTGSKSKLAIRFNGLQITNPKAFMTQYGKYIKIINQRLKLVEKRRTELHKRRGDEVSEQKLQENVITDLTDMDIGAVDYCIRLIDEALTAPDDEVFSLIEASGDIEPATIEGYKAVADYEREQAQKADRARHAAVKEAQKRAKAEFKANSQMNTWKMRAERTQKQLDAAKNEPKKNIGRQLPNEPYQDDDDDSISWNRGRSTSSVNMGRLANTGQKTIKTFDKEIFTDMDMKKANEAIPTFTKASIGFVIDETEEVVTRDVLIGIKSYLRKAPSLELINDVYNCIINKRKFLRFVKFISGEERSLSDLIFGIKELRSDALDAKGGAGQWRSAFKRRRRWAKISVPYLMKEYTPNGTIVMTMNEVDFIKSEYGIDIMKADHVRMLMDADFLLSFIILDQANEMVYVTYDGQGYGFQEYTYAMLEREQRDSDRMMRELYRSFSR